MNNHRRLIIFTLLSLRTDSANDRNQCGCEGDPDGRAGQTEKFPVVMKGLKTAGPAIRCLGQREKGKPVEVEEAVAGTERWKRSAGGWTIGVGVRRRGGVGEADEEAGEARSRARRNEKRREVEMVMGGIRERGGKKNCGGCCEKVGLKSFEGNGIINGCPSR